jgi:hypothetical protein
MFARVSATISTERRVGVGTVWVLFVVLPTDRPALQSKWLASSSVLLSGKHREWRWRRSRHRAYFKMGLFWSNWWLALLLASWLAKSHEGPAWTHRRSDHWRTAVGSSRKLRDKPTKRRRRSHFARAIRRDGFAFGQWVQDNFKRHEFVRWVAAR